MLEQRIDDLFALQQKAKLRVKNSKAEYRIKKLQLVKSKILELQDEIESALEQDFAKAPVESVLTEVLPVISMINQYSKKLKKWMKPKKVGGSLLFFGTKSYISYEAKGNCLVISPWNYPFQLSIYPVLTAFAAGNTVLLKPSEFTPATNKVVKKIIEAVFSSEEVDVIEGEVEASTLLLNKPFDHIFFTGSTPVGKIVMEKASKHLASVALELGGKSPVIIDTMYGLESAAKNIAWGKYVNGGQTCVAPDYILLPKGKVEEFVSEFKAALESMYPEGHESSKDYCRIITSKHADRLMALIEEAKEMGAEVKYGGKRFDNGKIEPTVISNVNNDMKVMTEEIFGPILPIVEYESLDSAIEFVNNFDNALALYFFSNSEQNINQIRSQTNSGGLSINETLFHVGQSELPFGGAGKSGLGKYHGVYGFEEMSNLRSVLHRKIKSGTEYFYPPYDQTKKSIMDKILKWFSGFL